ncbi:hypothetical protein [Sphingomonas sp. PB4P5]|uniref:hypothetical protein n=1 Tax=Parasphingomonas puruogangriensis TaxID=3096155 RepID=UPI002FC6EACD
MDIIRQRDGQWEALPAGLRVAWHPSGHQGIHWSKAISRARARKVEVRATKLIGRRQAETDQ